MLGVGWMLSGWLSFRYHIIYVQKGDAPIKEAIIVIGLQMTGICLAMTVILGGHNGYRSVHNGHLSAITSYMVPVMVIGSVIMYIGQPITVILPDPKTIAKGSGCRTGIVFAVCSAFLNIEEAVIAPNLKE